MPIFDYKCHACGHVFDVIQKVGAEALTECPECGRSELRKLLSAPHFHLKGGGWRKTKADEKNQRPKTKPRFAHTFDSPAPHAEHHDHDDSHAPGHDAGGKHNHRH